MAKQSCDVSAGNKDKQSILYCRHEETVGHALVLLEGEIKPFIGDISDEIAIQELKFDVQREEIASVGDKTLSNSRVNEVIIYQNGQCLSWPIVKNKFKAFVKLDRGPNLVKIQCHELNLEKELRICYEKQPYRQRFIRVVYINCSDSNGSFDAPDNVDNSLDVALQKLRFNALLLQTFMAEEMNRHGFGYRTFELEENENGTILVHVFTSELTTQKAHQMNGDELYGWFHKELTNSSLNDPHCKFLAFMSCSHYDPPDEINSKDITSYVKAHTALGGGKLGLFGTAGLHTWASELGELVRCFTDDRMIDKTKLFDDSAGRGTFWANYSTTLGAALHELGHCFDLMHTPEGIMSRGFDDLNHFFVMKPSSQRQCLPPAQSTDVNNAPSKAMALIADHRAHWFRSSAVLLHYHKWLQIQPKTCKTEAQKPQPRTHLNWSHDVKGPIGNGGGGQDNQSYFDDVALHNSRGLRSSGYVIYHDEYINAIVPLAAIIPDQTKKEGCPMYGKADKKSKVHTFPLDEGEYLTSLEIRAGAWVDGIRFHSNMKSSVWFGGHGGELHQLTPSDDERIAGIFGTFGEYLGSLGIRLVSSEFSQHSCSKSMPKIHSKTGIGLVVLLRKDELVNFWEFLDCPPMSFSLPESCWDTGRRFDEMNILTVDIEGNICRGGFIGYEDFMRGVECSEAKTDEKVSDIKK